MWCDEAEQIPKKRSPINRDYKEEPKITFEIIEDLMLSFSSNVKKIENYNKTMDNSKKIKKFKKFCSNLKKEKDQAKKKFKQLSEIMKKATINNTFLNDKKPQFNKFQKQFLVLSSQYEQNLNISIKKEKLLIQKMSDLNGSDSMLGYGENEDDQQQSQKMEQKFVLTEDISNTIETEREIEKQTLQDLKMLSSDMDDLQQCFKDVKDLLQEQQEGIDAMQQNVEDAAAHVEVGVETLKEVNNMPVCVIC